MAGSISKTILVGNVTADPEIRSLGSSGSRVANFSLATNESWRDKASGERKTRTEYHRIAVFSDGLVGVIERYVSKGSKLYLEGQNRTRKYQDRDGNDKYTTEVVLQGPGSNLTMLDSRDGEQRSTRQNTNGDYQNNQDQGGGQSFDLDDDVPW